MEHEVAMTGMQLQVISSATGWKYIQALLREKKLIAVIECDTDKVILHWQTKPLRQSTIDNRFRMTGVGLEGINPYRATRNGSS